MYPSVGMKRPQAHLSVNFGQKPFTFDIDSLVAVCTSYGNHALSTDSLLGRESESHEGDPLH